MAGDIGLQAGGLTCRWIHVAEQQTYTGVPQYDGFRWSDCAKQADTYIYGIGLIALSYDSRYAFLADTNPTIN